MAQVHKSVRAKTQPGYAPNRRKTKLAASVTEEEVEKWRILLDRDLTTRQEFLSVFEIETEDEEHDHVFVDFLEFQQHLDERMESMWAAKRRAEFRIPKSRRRGVSSWAKLTFFERMMRVPGWKGCIIAQTDPDSQEHLLFLDALMAQVPWEVLKRLGIAKIKSSARGIAVRHGRFKRSSIVVKTASARGLGRGGQLNGILQTERPHWAARSKRDRSAFLRSCAKIPGNIVIDESTACGYDEFYDDCMASQEGRNPAELVFLPSHHHEKNRTRLKAKELGKLQRSLGEEKRYGGAEETQVLNRVAAWRRSQGWDDEAEIEKDALSFVAWRREMIDGDCGHVTVFHREEPTTLEEAFSGAGRRVFPVDIMESWKEAAREKQALGQPGRLVVVDQKRGKELFFVSDKDSPLVVYEPPAEGETYCFGSDVASGFETHRDGSTEADFNVLVVKAMSDGRTVANVRGHIFPKPFARLLLEVSVFYGGADNPAMGYVETNLETVVAHLIEDEDLEVLGVCGEDILLSSERKLKVRGVGTQTVPEFGFKTTTKSKEYLISGYERFMVKWGEVEAGSGDPCPVDWQTLDEMLRFVRAPSKHATGSGQKVRTTAQAEAGHDDCVDAEMLAILARDELLVTGENEPRPQREEPDIDPVLAYMIAKRLKRENAKRGVVEPWYVPHPHGGKPINVSEPQHDPSTDKRWWGF